MKKCTYKIFSIIFILMLSLLLIGCVKSDDVINTEKQISAIGVVDENSLNKIEEAEKLFATLNDKEKGKVENYQILQSARDEYNKILVNNLEILIDTINYTDGEPSEEVKKIIQQAQKNYNSLPDEIKVSVKNYNNLENIIANISQFYIQQAQNAINLAIETKTGFQEAEDLYNALSKEEKEQISNYDDFANSFEAYKNQPPIDLISYRLGQDMLGDPQFYINAKNVSGKIIKEFTMTIFAFDEDGIPVLVNFNDYAKNLSYGKAIKEEQNTVSNAYWTLYGTYNEMKKIVVIIKQVEFFDETTWENPLYVKLYNKYNQKILSEDDENILTRK